MGWPLCRVTMAESVRGDGAARPPARADDGGRVLFTIGREQREVGPGTILHFPSGLWHGATMLDEEVILLDIFTPIRQDFLPPGGVR